MTNELAVLADRVEGLTLERDEAREQFDLHVKWPSDQIGMVEQQVDVLGEKLYLMSGPLRASGFLDSGENHRLYEDVVAAFREIGWKEDPLVTAIRSRIPTPPRIEEDA